MKKLFIFVMLCMFGALMPCFGDSTDAISFQEKEICRYFDKFKSECSKDSFDKLNRAIADIRKIQSSKVKNIKNYVSAIKNIEKIKTTFVYFKFGGDFTNNWCEDNQIRIYVNGVRVVRVGDISEHEGSIADNGKYKWYEGDPTWDLNFNNNNYYSNLYFENWIIFGFNATSKRFQISKYEIFAKSCETGEYCMNLDDEKQNARISLKFTDLPVIEK